MKSEARGGATGILAGAVGDVDHLAAARFGLGLLLFGHTLLAARELIERGYFGDVFHLPFIPERLVCSATVYGVSLAARVLAAALVTVGHLARPALLLSAALALYPMLCDRLQYHHNRWALVCFAFLLALTPCDRAWVLLDASRGTRGRRGPLWSVRLAAAQMSVIYLASGGSKLLDADWRGGLVIADRFARYGHQAIERGIPSRLVALASEPWATSSLAKVAITTELFLAVGLWLPRTRAFALWLGVAFHLTIEVSSRVEVFTWLSLVAYILFVTPDVRARQLFYDGERTWPRWLAQACSWLDWLARLEVAPFATRLPPPRDEQARATGRAIVMVDRDGTRATGLPALVLAARCLPLLFLMWVPLALVSSARAAVLRRRDLVRGKVPRL